MSDALKYALESADELRLLLEREYIDHDEHVRLILHEAEMLQHWAISAREETHDYPALSAELSGYAKNVQRRLRAGQLCDC